tara:strand:- start:362 stop:691 length:330 start_codon:yes stop_codon:yes gene_type:complete
MAAKPPGFYTIVDFMTMNEFERNQALREYRNLVQMGGQGLLRFSEDPVGTVETVKRKARRKKSAYSKALSRELKAINKKARTKSGRLRKGMTSGKILKKAHRAVKRRLK